MEDLLDLYHRPFDPRRPLVCLDEMPKQLVSEARQPLPARPGQPARYDYEYRREGVANLFMVSEPLLGWRAVQVTDRRTAKDFAEVLRWLAEDLHPDADRIVLVTDNLNTHGPGCLYEALPPARARRIAERLEWHYTPKHGSWLNVAECELAALSKRRSTSASSRAPPSEVMVPPSKRAMMGRSERGSRWKSVWVQCVCIGLSSPQGVKVCHQFLYAREDSPAQYPR
jgi:hypothetical protein